MTQEEALIYLPVDEENDAQDLYEEKLFELKQFFLNRFPVSKLIQARLAKFCKVEDAFRSFGGEISGESLVEEKIYPNFNSIHDLYKWYNFEKNSIRLKLSSAKSHKEVSNILTVYLQVTRFYAKYWKLSEYDKKNSSIKIGVEPNPMDIQSALTELSNQENLDSAFILTLPDDNCLKSEAKRLSLWLNFEINE